MNYEVGAECLWCACSCRMDSQIRTSFLDALDTGVEPHIDPGVARTFRQPAHKVGVEWLKHALRALKDGDLGARARGDVRELSGDVTAAHERDPLGQLVELQEFGVGDEVFFAGYAE